jgi:hypothetical protein
VIPDPLKSTLCERIGLIILVITGGRVIIVMQLGGLDARDFHDVRKAVAFSVPLGNNLFKERIEATLGKSVYYNARGSLNRVN